MKLGTIEWAGQAVPVCFAAQGILDLRAALPAGSAAATTLLDLIAGGQAVALGQRVQQMAAAGELAPLPADGVKPLAPIPRTARNVFCLGRNYADHIQEDNVSRDKQTPPPEYPQFFTKPSSAIVGDGAAIRYDERVTRRLDYEVELAVVIGTGGRDINAADALKHVLGYTIVNDVTARDLQRRHDQWFKGKGLDTFCPMGPWIVTADELDGQHTRVRCWVNGELRQDGRTEDLIFDIPTLIETISRGITLYPGDVIATGTPAGVGLGLNPPQFLKTGDVVRIAIDGIGEIQNRFA